VLFVGPLVSLAACLLVMCLACSAGVPINDVLVRFKNMTITGQVAVKTHKSPHLRDQLRDAYKVRVTGGGGHAICTHAPR
jgi:hypothetical protein